MADEPEKKLLKQKRKRWLLMIPDIEAEDTTTQKLSEDIRCATMLY
jgi:hypothetical protein